jgi:hypothetical protein
MRRHRGSRGGKEPGHDLARQPGRGIEARSGTESGQAVRAADPLPGRQAAAEPVADHGRIGQDGQQKRFVSPKAEDMRQVISERLRRRLSATRRIGCAYRLTSLDMAEGFDSAAWLPGDIMARFFQST